MLLSSSGQACWVGGGEGTLLLGGRGDPCSLGSTPITPPSAGASRSARGGRRKGMRCQCHRGGTAALTKLGFWQLLQESDLLSGGSGGRSQTMLITILKNLAESEGCSAA